MRRKVQADDLLRIGQVFRQDLGAVGLHQTLALAKVHDSLSVSVENKLFGSAKDISILLITKMKIYTSLATMCHHHRCDYCRGEQIQAKSVL